MSLINDALKRASEVPPPPPPVETIPPLRPAEHKSTVGWPTVVISVILLFVVAMGGWFVFKGLQAGQQLSADPLLVYSRETKSEEPAPSEQAQVQPILAPEPLPAVELAKAQPGKSEGAPTNTAQTAVDPLSPAPVFKLQGIFFRPTKPSALVNSKTVFVGDKIAKAKILAIGRESVTLEYQGETKVLTLE